MHHILFRQAFCEVSLELAAVVCEGFGVGIVSKRVGDGLMQFGRMRTACCGRCVGKGNMYFWVNGCEDVALYPIALAHDGVKRQALQGFELNPLGLARNGSACEAFTLPSGVGLPSTGAQFVWSAGNHASDGAHAWKIKSVFLAKRYQFGKYVFFAQIGANLAQSLDLSHDLRAPDGGSDLLWAFTRRHKGGGIATGLGQCFSPSVERALAYPKGMYGRRESEVMPVAQYF